MKRLLHRAVVIMAAAVSLPADTNSQRVLVDHVFAEFTNQTPGCAVGVEKAGVVQLQAGYGMADLERNVPITPDTVFESGSVAKQFTAAALVLAAQQGKLSLDDPLQKYLPELPDYGTPVTIRNVLNHVSGLREWRAIAQFRGLPEGRLVYTNHDVLEMAAKQRALNFEPGTHYSYTNTGFNVAPILLERALGTGETFPQFTRRTIFGPLGMTHTRWRDDYRAIVPNRALAYARSGSGFIQDTPVENLIGAGGMLTTVGDLLLWNENFSHPRVGGPEMLQVLQTPAVLKSGTRIEYAAGLEITQWEGVREISHGGSTGGYRTWLARYPDQGVSLAVLCNAANADVQTLGRETARVWIGAQIRKPARVPFSYAETALKELAGLYRNQANSTAVEVKWTNGMLVGMGGAWTPVAEKQFVAANGQKVFVEGVSPVRLRVVSASDEMVYLRVEAARPLQAELQDYSGKYFSLDTGTTVVISTTAPGTLSMKVESGEPLTLKPTYKDAFATPTGAVRFLRGPDGAVSGFSAGDGRTWDLQFERVRSR